MKLELAPLADDVQIIFYDQRGHGRSDHSRAEFWNLPTWADDLRRFCDALGLVKPVVLGSSFGGFVTLTYAGMFPGHPGGVILTNTTGGRIDHPASVEIFRRLGGDEAAAVAARDFAELTEQSADEFNRVCHPLYSSKPGFVEESRQGLARSIHTTEVNLHYFRNEAPRFDPWNVLADVSCPVLILAAKTTRSAPYLSSRTSPASSPPRQHDWFACREHATVSSATAPTSRFRQSRNSCKTSTSTRQREHPGTAHVPGRLALARLVDRLLRRSFWTCPWPVAVLLRPHTDRPSGLRHPATRMIKSPPLSASHPAPGRPSPLAPACQSHRAGPAWPAMAARGSAGH